MASLSILFEDNHLLVAEKPAGLLTQPSGTEQASLEEQVKQMIKKRDHKPGAVFLEAIHRLDKVASGIVIFAKSSKALTRLQKAIRERQCQKIYHALCCGHPPKNKGCLKHTLLHGDRKALLVDNGHPKGKQAELHYRVLKQAGNLSLVEVELITGRYHQIRAQFSAITCSLMGDEKYGGIAWKEKGIALHHAQFSIEHPTLKHTLTFESAPPWQLTQHGYTHPHQVHLQS